ncbi:hypothetical protein PVAP13_1KG208378 [Panicum virgatum]|uniref:Uncharacterized protein n=1 Tax=Panicum virgatum TaxID=38727 RepID=A0A8T0XJC3_PANVG|nr:hypothetical protein PVAP13_1KG208378 [Panicum virgatum]
MTRHSLSYTKKSGARTWPSSMPLSTKSSATANHEADGRKMQPQSSLTTRQPIPLQRKTIPPLSQRKRKQISSLHHRRWELQRRTLPGHRIRRREDKSKGRHTSRADRKARRRQQQPGVTKASHRRRREHLPRRGRRPSPCQSLFAAGAAPQPPLPAPQAPPSTMMASTLTTLDLHTT